ncbi:MAG: DUF167 domain-containing protein [Neomegalonema sp.]|nr:DUF167 domain-containing protein [Neomegalonema sp.]
MTPPDSAPDIGALRADGPDATLLSVWAHPKSSTNAVEGWVVDASGRSALKVRVSAPPSDGAANAAILKTLAKALGTSKSRLEIKAGHTARSKRIRIDMELDAVRNALEQHIQRS